MTRCTTITGGAGFIGANLANRLLDAGDRVTVFDDLSRDGSARNLDWLRRRHGERRLRFVRGDVRDATTVAEAVGPADWVVHLAGQVAVTRSVDAPMADFEANAVGTLNVLEALRSRGPGPVLLFASTNKVYGDLGAHAFVEEPTRWRLRDLADGIAETEPLDPYSPYGCSKAVGDVYVRDYARIYGLCSVVLRQSCIYGTRQHGIEDQGWVSWLISSARQRGRVRIFGDGKQVRDLLWIDDLLDLYEATFEASDEVSGEAFNIGGGVDFGLSVWAELGSLLERELGEPIEASHHPWRTGDQRVFLSDLTKARRAFNWTPRVPPERGVRRLLALDPDAHDD